MNISKDNNFASSSEKNRSERILVLQLSHGRIIPYYSSAYSLRCHSVVRKMNRKLISCGGAIFRDEKSGYSEQYRSLIITGLSLIKGNRSLEIYISRGKYLRLKYLERMKELVALSDIIIFEGPWQYPLIKNIIQNKLVVYDAHNVEYTLRSGNRYQDECMKVEGDLLSRADVVLSVTRKDMKNLVDIYHVNNEKLCFAPHLVDTTSLAWNGQNSTSIVFIGSIYGPNNSALDKVYELAQKYPQYNFEVIGSVRSAKRRKPKNLIIHGTVDEQTKDRIMSRCFLSLNPVTEGSGRNVKMMDYLAHGLPILSTPIGIRGFEEFDLSGSVVVADTEQFGEAIEKLSADREKLKRMSDRAKKMYENILKSEGSIDPEEIILEKYRQMKAVQR